MVNRSLMEVWSRSFCSFCAIEEELRKVDTKSVTRPVRWVVLTIEFEIGGYQRVLQTHRKQQAAGQQIRMQIHQGYGPGGLYVLLIRNPF